MKIQDSKAFERPCGARWPSFALQRFVKLDLQTRWQAVLVCRDQEFRKFLHDNDYMLPSAVGVRPRFWIDDLGDRLKASPFL